MIYNDTSGTVEQPVCKAVPSSFLERNFTLLSGDSAVELGAVEQRCTTTQQVKLKQGEGSFLLLNSRLQGDIEY